MTTPNQIVINVYEDPPTPARIAQGRQVIAANNRFEDSAAFKVLMYCPIPIVDMVAGLATHAVESSIKDDPQAPLLDVPGSMAMDWSESEATKAYVDKVRVQGRLLIAVEVDALKSHLATVNKAHELAGHAKYLVDLAAELTAKAGRSIFGNK